MVLLGYITCPTMDEARRIADRLLEERLIACANLFEGGPLSLYEWKGQKEETKEVLLLVKTTEARFDELVQRVRALHSYDVPCIVGLPVTHGDRLFLEWVEQQTQ